MTDRSAAIRALVAPSSIAVVGASTDPAKFGARTLRLLREYRYGGKVYPVNPQQRSIDGLDCYPTVGTIGDPVDVAVIAVPATRVLDALRDAGEAGARAAVVYAGGFAETGPAGALAQAELSTVADEYGIVLCGPNGQGVANLRTGAIASFSNSLVGGGVTAGRVAVIAQSGAGGGLVVKELRKAGVGVALLAATGNEAGVEAAEIAEVAAEDAGIDAILMFIEGVGHGDRFVAAARAAALAGKPLCVLKVGRTAAAREAVRSHTAALPVDDGVFDAVCARYGVLRVRDFTELADVGVGLGHGLPLARSETVVVTSTSGGFGTLMTDLLADHGLSAAELDSDLVPRIAELLPPFVAPANPVDASVLALDVPRYGLLLARLAAESGAGQVQLCVALQTWNPDATVDAIAGAVAAAGPARPVVVTWLGGDPDVPARLAERGIPTFDDPARALRLGGALARLGRFSAVPSAPPSPRRAPRQLPADLWRRHWGPEHTDVLLGYDLLACPTRPVYTVDDAVAAATAFGYPVALKLSAPDRPHKSDIGGLRLRLATPEAVRAAFAELDALRAGDADAVLVQRMAPAGAELFLAAKRDPLFGVVVLLGTGGVHVHQWGDVRVLVPPVSADEVRAVLSGLACAPLLAGGRGAPALDTSAVVRAVIGLESLAEALPEEVQVLEINPLIVGSVAQGSWVVDWRVDQLPAV